MGEAEQAKSAPERVETLHKRVELGKALFGLVRDSAIFVLLILFVVIVIYRPEFFTDRLRAANVKSLDVGFMSVVLESRDSSVTALRIVEQTQRDARQVIDSARDIAGNNPALKQLVDNLEQRTRRLAAAGAQLEGAAANQQDILIQSNAPAARTRGWVSVSNAVADMQGQQVVRGAIGLVRERNLRVRTAPGEESQVIGILPARSEFEVIRPAQGRPWAEVVQR